MIEGSGVRRRAASSRRAATAARDALGEALRAQAEQAERVYRDGFLALDDDERDDLADEVALAWLGKVDLGAPAPLQRAVEVSYRNRALAMVAHRVRSVRVDDDDGDVGAVPPGLDAEPPELDGELRAARARLAAALEPVLAAAVAARRGGSRKAAAATAQELRLLARGVAFDEVLEGSEGGFFATEQQRVEARTRFVHRHAAFRAALQAALDAEERRGHLTPARARVLRAALHWLGHAAGHLGPTLAAALAAGPRLAARAAQRPPAPPRAPDASGAPAARTAVGRDGQVDVARLLGADAAQPWLEAAASALAGSTRLLDRVAAAGLVARLGSPRRRPSDALAHALAGQGPTQRAVAWADRLTPRLRAQAGRELSAEARALAARLEEVALALTGAEAEGAAALLAWLHRRDDLESAARLLERAGAGEGARRALDALDREASLHLSAFGRARLSADPRLLDVLWQEPDAWWGGLAGG